MIGPWWEGFAEEAFFCETDQNRSLATGQVAQVTAVCTWKGTAVGVFFLRLSRDGRDLPDIPLFFYCKTDHNRSSATGQVTQATGDTYSHSCTRPTVVNPADGRLHSAHWFDIATTPSRIDDSPF